MLSSKGNPRLDNVNSIMHALGYRLMPEKVSASAVAAESGALN